MSSILDTVRVRLNDNQRLNIEKYARLVRPNYPTNCATLDLSEINGVDFKGLKQIWFDFSPRDNVEVEVHLQPREVALKRAYKLNHFGFVGPRFNLHLNSDNEYVFVYYAVRFHQYIQVENNPDNPCKSYDDNWTYDDCDEDFIRRSLDETYGPNFTPVWATDDMEKVTTKTFLVKYENVVENKRIYSDLLSGNAENDCPVPCKNTEISSVFLGDKHEHAAVSQYTIDIVFDHNISITVFYFPDFSFAEFLSLLGGSMGLWLGAGVLQIVDVLIRNVWYKINKT